MATPSRPPATAACSQLVFWCVLLLQLQACRGFFVPAPPSSPPPLGAADATVWPATASADAENVSGTTTAGSPIDDSVAFGPGTSSVSTAFQEFVERRKSGGHRVVLDLRPRVEFCRRHLQGSTSIPVDELAPRLLELPPPFGEPVSIVGSEEVCAFFAGES